MRYYLHRYFCFVTPRFSVFRFWLLDSHNLNYEDPAEVTHWIPYEGDLSDEAHVRRDKPFKRRQA